MLDPKSEDFGLLVHNWCEIQRMSENTFIINEYDTLDTKSSRNFFRNRVLNSQLEEAKNAIHSINNDSNQNILSNIESEESQPKEIGDDHKTEFSNSIAHSLVQIQNQKFYKLHKKLDEFSEKEPDNENS